MRLRVLDFGIDKYGLNAYIFDSTNDNKTNYNRVLFAPAKDGSAAVAKLAKGGWGDVKVKIVGGALTARPRASWSRSRSSRPISPRCACSTPR